MTSILPPRTKTPTHFKGFGHRVQIDTEASSCSPIRVPAYEGKVISGGLAKFLPTAGPQSHPVVTYPEPGVSSLILDSRES